jgi:hypothetical protein
MDGLHLKTCATSVPHREGATSEHSWQGIVQVLVGLLAATFGLSAERLHD